MPDSDIVYFALSSNTVSALDFSLSVIPQY